MLARVQVPNTYVLATTAYHQMHPNVGNVEALPGRLRVFESTDRIRWTPVTIGLPSDRTRTHFEARRRLRPAVWAARRPSDVIKFAIFYWDMEAGETSSNLIAATLTEEFGWTSSHPVLARDFETDHHRAFSPAVAAIRDRFVVAWGDPGRPAPGTSLPVLHPVKVARFAFDRYDSPEPSDISRYEIRQVGDVIDLPFVTTGPVTLTVQGEGFVLGFTPSSDNRLMISKSATGEVWQPPVDTDVPDVIDEPSGRRTRPFGGGWGASLTQRLDGSICLGTVAQTSVGTLGGPDKLMRFTSTNDSLTTWVLEHEISGLRQGAAGYSVVGPPSEPLEVYLDGGRGRLVARAGSGEVALPSASDVNGNPMVQTPPSVGFGHGVPPE